MGEFEARGVKGSGVGGLVPLRRVQVFRRASAEFPTSVDSTGGLLEFMRNLPNPVTSPHLANLLRDGN